MQFHTHTNLNVVSFLTKSRTFIYSNIKDIHEMQSIGKSQELYNVKI